MTVTVDEVQRRWLANIDMDADVAVVADSFARIEAVLGRPWLEAALGGRDPMAPVGVHELGIWVKTLERAQGREKLLDRILHNEPAARSELHAVHLCAADDDQVEVDIEPPIQVDGGPRVPDFAVRHPGEQWVYVEVSEPQASESNEAAQAAAASLRPALDSVAYGIAIEVRFREEPLAADLEEAASAFATVVPGTVIDRGRFVLRGTTATEVIPRSDDDEQGRPVAGCARVRLLDTGGVPDRAIVSVRVPFTDERAQRLVHDEAKQLPKQGPGVVALATSHWKRWRGLITRSFSPTIRRRVSGVLVFGTGIRPGDRGFRVASEGELLENPHARTPLPHWLISRLRTFPLSL